MTKEQYIEKIHELLERLTDAQTEYVCILIEQLFSQAPD